MVMSVPEGASSETTPIRYVRGDIPDSRVPSYWGDRYHTETPDALDLQDRAALWHQLPDRSHRARLPVVPKAFRDRFNLVPGTELEVEASGDGVTLRRVGAEPSLIRKKGILPASTWRPDER